MLHLSLLAILSALSITDAKVDTYSTAEKQGFLDIHNKKRRDAIPTAVAMNAVIWSARLECLAIKAAYKCKFDHSSGGDYDALGENIYQGPNIAPDYVTNLWFNEINNYDFMRDACSPNKVCGHYTQVMTADVVEIGCAVKRGCDGDKNKNLVFCEYSHQNGFYKRGVRCTMCPKDRPCENRLCTGQKQSTLPDGAADCMKEAQTIRHIGLHFWLCTLAFLAEQIYM